MSAVLENALVLPEDQQCADLLVRLGILEVADVENVMRQAAASGRSLEEQLAQTGQFTRGALIQM